MPSDAEEGSYGLRVRLWDPATVGVVGDLALRTFSRLFQVVAAALSPDELAQQFQEGLGTPSLSASPTELDPGQTVRVFYEVPSSAPFSFNPALALVVLGPNNNVVRTPLDRQISVSPGAAIAGQVDIDTSGLTGGQSYGVGIAL